MPVAIRYATIAKSRSVSEPVIEIATYHARGGFGRSTTPQTRRVTEPRSRSPSTRIGRA
jgi:hypothetical protein